ncbi:MAG: PH domain-containing protein [Lachnospira sp.]
MAKNDELKDILWKDRKRLLFFGLPWTFTRYSVSEERFFVSKGLFSIKDDEVRLYRIMDISLSRSLFQRMFNLGTIRICSGDKTLGDFEIKNIKNPMQTKELISDLVEKQRDKKRVVNRENMVDGHSHADDYDYDDRYEDAVSNRDDMD